MTGEPSTRLEEVTKQLHIVGQDIDDPELHDDLMVAAKRVTEIRKTLEDRADAE